MSTRRASGTTRRTSKAQKSGTGPKKKGPKTATKAKPGIAPKGAKPPAEPSLAATAADDAAFAKFSAPAPIEDWVSDEDCGVCVRAAVTQWNGGHDFYDFSLKLRDIYAPKGQCTQAALQRLRMFLGTKCLRTPPLSALSPTMSFAELRLLLCGG